MSFDISRLRRSDRIVGVGAVLFFIFLFFFKWYGFSTNAPSVNGVNLTGGYSINGWHTFTNSRWIWLITIVVALGAVAISMGALKLNSPVQPGVLVAGLGALSSLLIVYRILDHPSASASFAGVHTTVGIKIGIWLGLIAAVAITYGGYLGMQAEGTSLADVREQASGAISGLASAVGTDGPGSSGSGASAGTDGSGSSGSGASAGTDGSGSSGSGASAGAGDPPQAAPPIPPPIPPVGGAPAAETPEAGGA
jgi:hypothetical protein